MRGFNVTGGLPFSIAVSLLSHVLVVQRSWRHLVPVASATIHAGSLHAAAAASRLLQHPWHKGDDAVMTQRWCHCIRWISGCGVLVMVAQVVRGGVRSSSGSKPRGVVKNTRSGRCDFKGYTTFQSTLRRTHHTRTHTHTYIHAHTHTYTYTHTYTHTHIHILTHTHTYTHTNIRTYTHAHTPVSYTHLTLPTICSV